MKRCPGVKPRESGFTLIEVLVALAIVAIGMAAVLGALTSSASTVLYMRDKTLAQWIALNHIAEERLKVQLPVPFESIRGRCELSAPARPEGPAFWLLQQLLKFPTLH